MAQQVQFYSVTATGYSDIESKNNGGIYFVTGGELYKGTERFGGNKVFQVTEQKPISSITGQIGGDVAIGDGWTKMWNGSAWVQIENDVQIAALVRPIVSSMVSNLAGGDASSYITHIVQDANGNVSAHTAPFPTLNLVSTTKSSNMGGFTVSVTTESGAVKNVQIAAPSYVSNTRTEGSTANGITTSVTTENGQVTEVSVIATDLTPNTVSASSGIFTNLTVTNTATFNVTDVSAQTLTVGGIPVNNVSLSSKSGNDAGIAVTVSTLGGGVSAVGVAVTSATLLQSLALTDFAGKNVVETVRLSGTGAGYASNDSIATELAVRNAIDAAVSTFDNVMNFKGVVKALPTSGNKKGDIVVIDASPTGTDPQGETLVQGQEYIWTSTATTTDPSNYWELIGDQKTYAIESVVKASLDTKAEKGSMTATPSYGVGGGIILMSNSGPTLNIDVKAASSAQDITNTNSTLHNNVVTANAVKDYVEGVLPSHVYGGSITLMPLGGSTSNMPYISVKIAESTAIPTITSYANWGTAISKNYTTTSLNATGVSLTTESVVADYVESAISSAALVWLNESGQPIT